MREHEDFLIYLRVKANTLQIGSTSPPLQSYTDDLSCNFFGIFIKNNNLTGLGQKDLPNNSTMKSLGLFILTCLCILGAIQQTQLLTQYSSLISKEEDEPQDPAAVVIGSESADSHETPPTMEISRDQENTAFSPRLIIHIGLHKTGTSSIQYAMSQLKDLLKEDHLHTFLDFADCGVEVADFSNAAPVAFSFHKINGQLRCPPKDQQTIRNQLQHQLQQHATNKNNNTPSAFLMSTEEFVRPILDLNAFCHLLAQVDPTLKQNTQIILYHRPLLQWLPSLYFQLHRPKQSIPPPFPSLVQALADDSWLTQRMKIFTTHVAPRWKQFFPHVQIRAYTNNNVLDFLCHALSAPRACRRWTTRVQQQQSSTKNSLQKNSKTSLEYIRLYYEAIERKLIPPWIHQNPQRAEKFLRLVQQRLSTVEQSDNSSALPMVCVSGELRQRLKRMAIETPLPPNTQETSSIVTLNGTTTSTNDGRHDDDDHEYWLDQLCSLDIDQLFRSDNPQDPSSWTQWIQRQVASFPQ